ncbi:hypothetical protein K461DRAFT_270954 [Myriangium duriaei CBS 260.36]|uniref:DM2 domain-containing protein n=1 Tax=Myriangium duriaei CBS 260.36 TaxID=1168546 RepID=A0A9P4IX64_9PEZI|nr:hypothetical protein K461DRAFT_270954 [Myriangium duriaei CBS 260.36]
MQAGRSYAQPRAGRPQSHAYAQQHQAQNQAALVMQRQQQEAEARRREREAAHRISKRPADRNIPNEIAEITIGDGVERYKKLRDMERRLDATMMHKRLDLTDPYRQRTEVEGTLRIWISNTAEGQPWQLIEEGGSGLGEDGTFDFADNSQATYRVKIEGRLLDDPADADDKKDQTENKMDQDGADTNSKPTVQRPRFSDFFERIKIDFDRAPSLQPDGMSSLEWKRPSNDPAEKARQAANPSASENSFDTLEFQRKGDEELNITVNLYRVYTPQRFALSKSLGDLLDVKEIDLASAIAGIWDYVRAHGLQEDDEHRRFICDDRLRSIFGLESITFPQLREVLVAQKHMTALPPVQLPYTIRLDKSYLSSDTDPSAPTIYDIRVSLPSPLTDAVKRLIHDPSHLTTLKQIQDLDTNIAELVQALSHSAQKHKFLSSLAADPAGFIRRWLSSQKRDLEIMLAEGGRGYGEDGPLPEAAWRGGEKGMWGSEGVREGVGVWLARARAR